MILSLRHGPAPIGRRMFEVSAEETVRLAETEGWTVAFQLDRQTDLFGRPDVTWTRLAFRKGGEGLA